MSFQPPSAINGHPSDVRATYIAIEGNPEELPISTVCSAYADIVVNEPSRPMPNKCTVSFEAWPIEKPAMSAPRPNEPIRLIDKVALEMLDVGEIDSEDHLRTAPIAPPRATRSTFFMAESSRLGK